MGEVRSTCSAGSGPQMKLFIVCILGGVKSGHGISGMQVAIVRRLEVAEGDISARLLMDIFL